MVDSKPAMSLDIASRDTMHRIRNTIGTAPWSAGTVDELRSRAARAIRCVVT